MNIQAQLDRVRAQKEIEDVGTDNARLVLHAAVNAFRKWLSPVRSPAASWIANLETMLVKCRLDGDALAFAQVLAVRAAAQIEGTIRAGEYDELAVAAGLDILTSSQNGIGAGQRITIGEDVHPANSYRIVYQGIPIVIRESSIEGETVTDDKLEAVNAVDALSQRNTGGVRYVEMDYGPAPEIECEIFDTVHDPWRPSTVYTTELKAHPTQIIEPSTLAATPYPRAVYKPLLPAEAIKRGFISDAQFETIVYALQAVTTYLPGAPNGSYGRRPKGGFIIGDGTGVGKTNEICGVIMDQWMRGKKRHIVVVERSKHVAHFREAWAMIGGAERDVFFQGDNGAGDAIPDRDGIIITTYALVRDDRRYNSLLEWANSRKEFDGIMAFDEAHNMRNAVEDNHDEGSGKRNQSQQGMRGVELQDELPEGGVIYASATMATDVYNLGYAPRLGLWGQNAPFSSASSFIGEMHTLDDAALEQICIDLKAAGRYCSRTLSFDGVEYEEIVHRLTPAQRHTFDESVRNWRTLHDLLKNAVTKAGGKAGYYSQGRLTQMRRALVEQLLSSFNVETLIEDIHKEIANGNAPVIQIAYTGEARLARMAQDRDYIPVNEYRDEELINWIIENFPETRLKYDATIYRNVPVTDSKGNPVVDPQASVMKQQALKIAEELAFRNSVLDRILLEFGDDNVAEVTGRSIRAIPDVQKGELKGWRIVDRSSQSAMDDVQAFHEGKKSILIFSLAAGGTGLGYQAAEKSRNKRRRIHYIMELGRRAESAVQGLGRTHRSDQVIPPHVKIVMSDIPAHAIYSAKTLQKIQKMGALSRGHQHATTNAIFEQRIPISGRYATEGWRQTLVDIQNGELGDITVENLARDLDLKNDGKDIHDLERAINRLAILTAGDQGKLVERLTQNTEEAIAKAIRQGTYNQGMETIRANSIEIVDENQIENANGSKTTYYRLRRRDEVEHLPFRRVAMTAAAARAKKSARAAFMRHKVSGRIILGVLREGPSGIIDIYSPSGTTTRHKDGLRQEPWKVIERIEEAERLWELESENLDTRSESDFHILAGSLLYNWDKLPKSGFGLNRCRTDDGKVIVGRVVNQRELRRTLAAMGMQSNYKAPQVAAMLARVDKGATIAIDNGWKVEGQNGGNYRLVVPDQEQTGSLRNDLVNLGIVAKDTPLGYELEIPKQDAIDILQSIAVGCDISIEGHTQNGTATTSGASFSGTAHLPIAACK